MPDGSFRVRVKVRVFTESLNAFNKDYSKLSSHTFF